MYFCKICGRQLEKEGDICIDCYEGLIEEESNDEILYTMRAQFNIVYELMKSPFTFFLIFVLLIVSIITGFQNSIINGVLYILVYMGSFALYFLVKKIRTESRVIDLYKTKLVYKRKLHFKNYYEVSYNDIDEIQFEDLNKKSSIINQSSWWMTKINKKFKMSELFFRLKKSENSLFNFGFFFKPVYNFEEEAMPNLMKIMSFEKKDEEQRSPLEEILNIKKTDNKVDEQENNSTKKEKTNKNTSINKNKNKGKNIRNKK